MKILALSENTTSDPRLGTEHGLSLYIEACGKKILFDTGQGDLFAENAAVLGVDLAAVDLAVISHGHYDHGGGIARFLKENRKAPVYVSSYAFERHFNAAGKDIGLDPALQGDVRIRPAGDRTELAPGITLLSRGGRPWLFPLQTGGLQKGTPGRLVPEDFRHEQYLLIEENGQRVLFSGCSHRGILNISAWFKPDVLIGGFHFFRLPLDDTLASYADRLNDTGIRFLTCHCTGAEQYAFLQPRMPRLSYLAAGDEVEL